VQIRTAGEFLDYWDSVRARTRRVVACIPPDRLEWTHRDGAFTLGDLVRHLAAIERYMYAETVAGRPSRYQGCGRDLADGFPAVLEFFDRLDRESRQIIGALSDTPTWRGNARRPPACRSRRGSGCARWWSTKSITAARST